MIDMQASMQTHSLLSIPVTIRIRFPCTMLIRFRFTRSISINPGSFPRISHANQKEIETRRRRIGPNYVSTTGKSHETKMRVRAIKKELNRRLLT